MILRQFKAIFVHIPKTGGQSVSRVLLDALGKTWETAEDLAVVINNEDETRGPVQTAHLFGSEYVKCGWASAEEFRDFFKFSIVRNPYERLVSDYKFSGAANWISLSDFVFKKFPEPGMSDRRRHLEPQWRFVCDDAGRIIVDEIIRFEEIGETAPRVLSNVLGADISLPLINASADRTPASEFYDERTENFVRDFYGRDFELFGYKRM